MEYKNYTRSAFIIEKKINLYQTIKRIDMIILSNKIPKILVECKAPNICIRKKTFEQAARYNSLIKAKKVLITNGLIHYFLDFNFENHMYSVEKFDF